MNRRLSVAWTVAKVEEKRARRRKNNKLFHLIQQNKPQIATIRKMGQIHKKADSIDKSRLFMHQNVR